MKPVDNHRHLYEVYGEHSVSNSVIRSWVRRFNEGRENVHDATLKYCHDACTGLTGCELRDATLKYCHDACTGLTGYQSTVNTQVTNLSLSHYKCSRITSSIPSRIFHMTKRPQRQRNSPTFKISQNVKRLSPESDNA
jgi:hypothetical protein